MRALVQLDGRGDLHHLQERDRALLHAGAARARRRQQRQPFGGRPLDGHGDPLGRRHPDRAGEEVELARHHRDPPAEDAALPGDDRFVQAGRGLRRRQLAAIFVTLRDRHGRGVPATERFVVQHGIPQLKGTDPAHRTTLIGWGA